MSALPSLYRRHRPRTFSGIVGQQHVIRTLKNAIKEDRLHHAYLFVGSRGTGKTSMAKILAAALNCRNRADNYDPCTSCQSCSEIASGASLDVLEMDAASHNSVDDIRDLRDKVAFAPVSGHFKIYILDEAHMLSTAAWNAFLKTLEEPPPQTIFILATTEAQKVLPTVVDRCHRFDFSRPSIEEIDAVLARVTDAESIELSVNARRAIARAAAGSFRDALGTLEQLVAYAGPTIDSPDVHAVLGMVEAELLFGLVDSVAKQDARGVIEAVARLVDSGRDLSRFLIDLEAHLRDLLLTAALGEVPAQIAVSAEHDSLLLDQARTVEQALIIHLLEGGALTMRRIKDGADPRTQIEALLIKASSPQLDATTTAILSRIERLEVGGVERKDNRTKLPEESAEITVDRKVDRDQRRAKDSSLGSPVSSSSDIGSPVGLEQFRQQWPSVVSRISERSPMLAALLNDAHPNELEDKTLTLSWAGSAEFLKRKAEDQKNKDVIVTVIREVTGLPLNVTFELCDEGELALLPPAEVSGDSLVKRIIADFDGEEIVPSESES